MHDKYIKSMRNKYKGGNNELSNEDVSSNGILSKLLPSIKYDAGDVEYTKEDIQREKEGRWLYRSSIGLITIQLGTMIYWFIKS